MAKFGSDDYKPAFSEPPLLKRAWSYSMWSMWNKCRLSVRYKYVEKKAEVARAASDRGTKIHDMCEQHVKSGGKVGAVPPVWVRPFQTLIKRQASAELKLGLTKAWEVVDWFDPRCWLRGKVDAHLVEKRVAEVYDYKTGRVYPDHPEQVDLYSVGAFSLEPKLKEARGYLWYLDQGPEQTISSVVKADEVDARRVHWVKAVEPMLTAVDFPAMPGRHCSWCGYSQKKGGPCTSG